MKRVLSLLVLALLVAAPAAAQVTLRLEADSRPVRPLVHYGKWVLLAGAIGMNYLAAESHHQANERYDAISVRCFADESLCSLAADGTYRNAETEALYQATLHYDRRARGWLFGGEAALLGTGAMFLWELARSKHLPPDIPFEPHVSSRAGVTRIGLSASF